MTATTKARDSRIFERHGDDWYREPEWPWIRLFERLALPPIVEAHDPACGAGTAVRAALKAGMGASGSDIVARWEEDGPFDVLDCFHAMTEIGGLDLIVSNPPFKLAEGFASAAIQAAPIVALLLPATWAHGHKKGLWMENTPLSDVLALTPRPTMVPGLGLLEGQKLGGGTKDFSIYVWRQGHVGPARFGWLRRDLPSVPHYALDLI